MADPRVRTAPTEPGTPTRETLTSDPAPAEATRRRRTGGGSAVDAPAERRTSSADERAPEVVITHEDRITGDPAEQIWRVYQENFEPLAELAMLQHCFPREEVLAELANPNIHKIVGWSGGDPVGLGMVTNDLDAVPQISPRFLTQRYPEHNARDAIYFGILVMVAPHLRGRTLFTRIYTEMWQIPARSGGILVFDICDFNRLMFDTDALTRRIAAQFPGGSVDVVDHQTWYVAELPEPIPDAPRRP